MITLATTFWKCPHCDTEFAVDGTELAEIGTPVCSVCDREAEPMDDPIPVIVKLTDGKQSIKKIICRPADMEFAVFQVKVFQAWQEWKKGGPRADIPNFEAWLELSCHIHCMFSEAMTV